MNDIRRQCKYQSSLTWNWTVPQMKAQSISEEAQEGKVLLLEKFDDHNWLDVFNLRTGFFLLNSVPSLRAFIVRWACTFLVNGVEQASKDDEWDDFEIFLKHFCPTVAYVLNKNIRRQDVSGLTKSESKKLLSICSGIDKIINVILKGASQKKYYNLYYTGVHLLLKGIFKTDPDSCRKLRDKHFKQFRFLLSALFSVPAQNKIWAKCVAEVVNCVLGEIEDVQRDDILIEFVKCIGAESERWTIEKTPVLGLILENLPPHVSLEIIDLFVQDQLKRVLKPHKYINMAELTDVIQEWIVIIMTLDEGGPAATADFMKKSVWIFRQNLLLLVVQMLNRGADPLLENDFMGERIRSFVLDCSPPLSPLPVLLAESMDLKGIEQWLSRFFMR